MMKLELCVRALANQILNELLCATGWPGIDL